MKRRSNGVGPTRSVRVWAYLAVICLLGAWPEVVANQVTIPLFRNIFLGAFGACGFWLLLAALLGVLGGRYRSWYVTLGGVVVMSIGTHIGTYVYHSLHGVTPGTNLLPNLEELAGVLLCLTIGTVVAAFAHRITADYLARRARPGYCRECGYNLTGNVSGVCPECGKGV